MLMKLSLLKSYSNLLFKLTFNRKMLTYANFYHGQKLEKIKL